MAPSHPAFVLQQRPRRGKKVGWIIFAIVIAVISVGGIGIGILSAFSGAGDDILSSVGLGSGVDQRDVPGDARSFDPIARLPEVAAYAGAGARLVALEVALVRADGTLDLEAPYTPKPTAKYTFAREVPRPADAAPPGVGGSGTGPWHERITIVVSDPGERRRLTTTNGNAQRTVNYVTKGMQREVEKATASKTAFIDTVACPPKQLWQAALTKGAPADGVARISYESAGGIRFNITGVLVLDFKPDCTAAR